MDSKVRTVVTFETAAFNTAEPKDCNGPPRASCFLMTLTAWRFRACVPSPIQAAVEFRRLKSSWTSFVDDVKRCFRGSPETAEAGCGYHFTNSFFAGLCPQAEGDLLRTRTRRAQQS
jgi:hypothetical protein